MTTVLIIDGANVVGSRPDGWWRDRAGAARRLHDRVALGDLGFDRIILVLEGQARAGVPEGIDRRIETVHATADGDALIIEVAAGLDDRAVTVVTADRGLSERVSDLGAELRRPGWLLDQLT